MFGDFEEFFVLYLDESVTRYFLLNREKAQLYLDTYLDLWKNNQIKAHRKGLMRASKQVKSVTERINSYVWDDGQNREDLFISKPYVSIDSEIDFVAVILFLERVKCLKIKSFNARNNLTFQISLSEKFNNELGFLSDILNDYAAYNDLEYLETGIMSKEHREILALKAMTRQQEENEKKQKKVSDNPICLEKKPDYEYLNIAVFCDQQLPEKVLSISIGGRAVRNQKIRAKDWEVLKELVKAKGNMVSLSTISEIILGESYDEFYSSQGEVHRSINRLKKIEGISIQNKRGHGYFLKSLAQK